MLRQRPIRAKIYQQITRAGVPSEDWKYIVGITFFGWTIPIALNMTLWGLPICPATGVLSFFITYGFCYWLHAGKKPMWLTHQINSLLKPYIERGSLPIDRNKKPLYRWITR